MSYGIYTIEEVNSLIDNFKKEFEIGEYDRSYRNSNDRNVKNINGYRIEVEERDGDTGTSPYTYEYWIYDKNGNLVANNYTEYEDDAYEMVYRTFN